MLVRVTQSVKDYGTLVHPDEVEALIDDPSKDWYKSPFYYGNDVLEYFKEHKNSIKGYTGEVWTDSLYWDLDCKGNFEEVREGAICLINKLIDLELDSAIELYFSGNKGVHVFLRTKNKFTPDEAKKICYNLAYEAGVLKYKDKNGKAIFDTTVYNINRIFRIPNTKHQESGLFKIQLDIDEFEVISETKVRKLAKKPAEIVYATPIEAEFLKEDYNTQSQLEVVSNIVDITSLKEKYIGDFNPLDCPPDKRRCIYVLENGYFGPGERENASIRLAAYYHGQNWTKEQTFEKLVDALDKRAENYPDATPWKEEDVHRVVDLVYSEGWNGGTYSCKTDDFLRSKCDVGAGPCCNNTSAKPSGVTVGGLIDQYINYGLEALDEYPKTGLDWVDNLVRFRPRNYSIINGANGSGKTAFSIQWMEHLNEQKMWHIIFSADMANTSLFEKMAARNTDLTPMDIERAFNKHFIDKEAQKRVTAALREKYPYSIFDFTSALTSRHIEREIRLWNELGYKIQIGFIDYAGRMIGDNDSQYQNATQIALEANDIAKRTNTHLCYISQIPRDEGDHTRPLRSSRVSKDSGAWEENATIVINVWRPMGDGIEDLDSYMHIYIAKNRSGALAERVFWWEGKQGRISNISEEEFKAYKGFCEELDRPKPYEQFENRTNDRNKLQRNDRYRASRKDNDKETDQLHNDRESRATKRGSKLSKR